jgi:Xaa-Pro aminopeptidase
MDLTKWQESPSFYAGDELHAAKQEKIQKALGEHMLDAFLLTKSEAVRYATDFYVKGYRPFMEPEYLAVIPKGRKPVVGHSSGSDNYRIQIKSDIEDHRKLPGVEKWSPEIVKILRDYGITSGRVGVDFLHYAVKEHIARELPGIEFVDIHEIWIELTVIKHPIEIEILRGAVEIAEMGIQATIDAVKPGMREYELAAVGEYVMKMNGSEMTPFVTNIASGYNASIFERIATEKRIRYGEMLIIDMGCVYKGYTGDLGRSLCVGGRPAKVQKEIYQVNHRALMAAIEAVKPGVTCGDIDEVARTVIREAGWGQYEHKFATGHQVGYGLHGEPAVNKGVKYVLRPGMVMCLEPRITVYDDPEIGGAHIEDTVLVTENGCEKLSRLSYCQELLD